MSEGVSLSTSGSIERSRLRVTLAVIMKSHSQMIINLTNPIPTKFSFVQSVTVLSTRKRENGLVMIYLDRNEPLHTLPQ